MATPLPREDEDRDDSWAWLEHHYRSHRSQLYGSAIGILRNAHDAEDAIQIALVNAYRALARGDRPSHPRAWLFAIVLNACRRLLKTRAQAATAVGTCEHQAPAPVSDRLARTEIVRTVEALQVRRREAFTLRELRGLSYSELSETLGVSEVVAESRLATAPAEGFALSSPSRTSRSSSRAGARCSGSRTFSRRCGQCRCQAPSSRRHRRSGLRSHRR